MRYPIHTFLDAIANHIQEYGWAQGGSGCAGIKKVGTPSCTLVTGMILMETMAYRTDEKNEILELAMRTLIRATGMPVFKFSCSYGEQMTDWSQSVAHWNDDPNRSRNECIASLRSAALLAKLEDLYVEVTDSIDELIKHEIGESMMQSVIKSMAVDFSKMKIMKIGGKLNGMSSLEFLDGSGTASVGATKSAEEWPQWVTGNPPGIGSAVPPAFAEELAVEAMAMQHKCWVESIKIPWKITKAKKLEPVN